MSAGAGSILGGTGGGAPPVTYPQLNVFTNPGGTLAIGGAIGEVALPGAILVIPGILDTVGDLARDLGDLLYSEEIYRKVYVDDANGQHLAEFDEINTIGEGKFTEHKDGRGIGSIAGTSDQTPMEWAEEKIGIEIPRKIRALINGVSTSSNTQPPSRVPDIDDIRNIRTFEIRLMSQNPDVFDAVESVLETLHTQYEADGWVFRLR